MIACHDVLCMLIRPPPYKADTSVSVLDLRPTHQVRDRLHAASMSDIHTAIEHDGEIEAYVIGRLLPKGTLTLLNFTFKLYLFNCFNHKFDILNTLSNMYDGSIKY